MKALVTIEDSVPNLRLCFSIVAASGVCAIQGFAQAATQVPATTVQVTATRFPEDPAKVPASITVITGQELRDRGATDLASALAMAAGVYIAPGGDNGPASSVPEFWGLKEFDAFLLVVDGVPWGGTFNPALGTLNLQDVERIEVQRGAAPVMYGATSFVGVIHVIHKLPSDAQGSVTLAGGNHGSGSGVVTLKVPKWAGFDSSLTADYAKKGFDDPRTQFTRSHLLWRNRMELAEGSFHFDVDWTSLDQNPASPHPRVGKVLTNLIAVDTNHNPAGAFLNDRRVALNAGFDRALAGGLWSTTLAFSQSKQDVFRGFLVDVSQTDPNAHGFREEIQMTDIYFDSHIAWTSVPQFKTVAGIDHMHGQGKGRGGDFDYFVNLDGTNPPSSNVLPSAAAIRIDNRRDFSGLYAFTEWMPTPRLVVEAGVRLNRTDEARRTTFLDLASGDFSAGQGNKTYNRFTGSAGLNWTAWQDASNQVVFFANYRNTFKPSAIDFGVDSTSKLLLPETAQSVDLGMKAKLLDGKLALEVSSFLMDMDNKVSSQLKAGDSTPTLINSGKQRFQGVEADLRYRFAQDLFTRVSYSYHDARFRDFVFEFDPGVPTQLAGNRQEMSPYHLGALGFIYAPASGFTGSVELNYMGGVYLNKRNTAPVGGYTTLAAGLGYRTGAWEFRVDGQNLTNRRNPVAESELGDSQYYLLPGRSVNASIRMRF
jgi:iron complex outermembrane receptor protein